MMKEYIEKELLKERFLKWLPPDGDWDYQSMGLHPIENIAVSAIMEIEEVPAADVREVVHAKWKNIEPYVAMNGKYLKAQICGNCGAYFVSNGNKPYSNHPYCCECGAQMDLE